MILAHPQKCVACHLCEGACSFQHEGAFQPARSRIFVHDFVDEAVYLPLACFHCSDAPCMSNCAVVIGRAEHVQDLGVVQAMIRRRTDVSRWRHMLHGERINYGMLAFESAKR